MSRRRKYRRSLFKVRLKSQTIYTIVAICFFSIAVLFVLSFFQDGPLLSRLSDILNSYFGWTSIFLPLVFASLAAIFLRFKSPITKPNIFVGVFLVFLAFLGITKAGLLGEGLFTNIAYFVSSFGAIFIFLGALIIGISVLFNTSLDELILTTVELINKFIEFIKQHILAGFFTKKQKRVFIEEKNALMVRGGNFSQKDKAKKSYQPPLEGTREDIEAQLRNAVVAKVQSQVEMWECPPFSLLDSVPGQKADRGDINKNAAIIERTLDGFGIKAHVVEVNLGPAVTQYALKIALGTKLSKITALSNDLALALAAPTGQIRIEAPIPGRSLMGIEIPNKSLEFVTLRQMLESQTMRKQKAKLLVALGLDVSGNPVVVDIGKMPHILIAGTTGSGKSVLINSWISSLLFRTNPNELKLILVDPKRVELTLYDDTPHLLTPVIVDPEKIISALKWTTKEMDRRYKLFAKTGVRNIDSYNEAAGFQDMPYIVVFIDELADLMAFAPSEVEDSICRIAQMARATGIHLVISTQRPSVDVITGLIKANIPCRVAFNVSSMVDSRVIIDLPGAEKLLGRGDMLFIPPDQAKPTRIQGTFVSESEVHRLVNYLKGKGAPIKYTEEVTSMPVKTVGKGSIGETGEQDEFFDQAVRIICQYDRASASLLQRKLKIGYARAARILDQLEDIGLVGPSEGSKPREVLSHNVESFLSSQKEETVMEQ